MLTVRQTEAVRAWEGQMFPCRHRGEMFAMPGLCLLSTESPAGCPVSLLGDRTGGRKALRTLPCAWPGLKEPHLTQLCLFYSSDGLRVRGGLAGPRWRPDWMSELPRRRLTLPALRTLRMETNPLLSNLYTAGFGIGMKAFVFDSKYFYHFSTLHQLRVDLQRCMDKLSISLTTNYSDNWLLVWVLNKSQNHLIVAFKISFFLVSLL